MADRFAPGDRVRTSRIDPPQHTRLPRYARGAIGTVVEVEGHHPLPEDRCQGRSSEPEPVYLVRFRAADLFGPASTHEVRVALWESYLVGVGDE